MRSGNDAETAVGADRKLLPPDGETCLPLNPAHRDARPVGVGRLFRTKVNANIGRSTERSGGRGELRKLKVSLDAGADFVMDLSVGPGLGRIRQGLLGL